MDQDFFKLGVQAANAGDYQKAQAYFIRVVQANPNFEMGWLYLGHCLEDPAKRVECYKRVLRLNPSNQEAQRSLSALTQPSYPQQPYQDVYERQPAPVRSVDQARQMPPVQAAKPQKRPSNIVGWLLGSVAGLVVCVGVVCFAVSQMPPATPAPPTATPVPTQALPALDAAVLPAPVTSTGAGKVCLGFWRRGAACLDDKGWQMYSVENSELPDDLVTAGVICPDGRLAIAHAKGISLVRDGQWEHIPQLAEGYGVTRDLACDRDGRLWAAHHKGVSRYVNGAWQTYDIGMLAGSEVTDGYVSKIFAAPDGRIWAQTLRSVAMFADEKWTVFQMGQGLLKDPSALTLDATGRAWVWFDDGAAFYDNGSWKQFQSPVAPVPPESISLDARGWLWMGSFDRGVAVFNGSTWSSYSKGTQSLSSDKVEELTTDSLGRVWVATSYGLSVFDGSQWQTYRMDNSDLMDSRVTFVSVERDGPFLLPPIDKPKASIIGWLGFQNGDPLAQKRIEICAEQPVLENFGSTPCDGQPFHVVAQTDAQGFFAFADVPPGYYWVSAETNNGWVALIDDLGSNKQILIKPGEQYDMGELVFVNK